MRGIDACFNPPLPCGVVSSYKNIWAPVGHVIQVVGLEEDANKLIRSVTDQDELTYQDIHEKFPLQRHRNVPSFIPDPVYSGARGLYNHLLDTSIVKS